MPWKWVIACLTVSLSLISSPSLLRADDKPAEPKKPAVDVRAPESVEELRALQDKVRAVVKKVSAATVGIRIGASSGSGVIVSEDGYVLTAGHVAGEPDKPCTLLLSDGSTVRAKTLGVNRGIDSGMIKISEEGKKWAFAEMGESKSLQKGQWVVSIGHPGGYQPGRDPVVRLGRVLNQNDFLIQTDCTLVGGDSGGPLFDLEGKVIGIHSRIGGPITANIHVPVATYRETWDRLAKGEAWGRGIGGAGGRRPNNNTAFLGVRFRVGVEGVEIEELVPGAPAEKAGFKVNDKLTRFGGVELKDLDHITELLDKRKPGDEVEVEVLRGKEKVTIKVVLGRQGG